MYVETDHDNKTSYIGFAPRTTKVDRTLEVTPGLLLDLDANDNLIGIEMIGTAYPRQMLPAYIPAIVAAIQSDTFSSAANIVTTTPLLPESNFSVRAEAALRDRGLWR